ncbi:MAG TPA: isochorismate synthase [Aldersonia sp.]
MTDFLFARAGSLLRASGASERFPDVRDAVAATRAGTPLIVGALPFDPHEPAALAAPQTWSRDTALRSGELPAVRVAGQTPSPQEHVARVRKLLGLIADGTVAKVVAARSVHLTASTPIDPEVLLARLMERHPSTNGFVVPVDGTVLVGASPELLVARHGRAVTLRPLAGTAPRRADPAADRAAADSLLASVKNHVEHAFVVAWIRERMAPLCIRLDVPESPVLVATPQVWHLASPVTGVLRDPATTALEVALALHPTPAVCGTPTDAALEAIRTSEEGRGFYGGAVGWCDGDGDGEWVVAIRCADVSADGLAVTAWAGGGIVAGSDPVDELDETTAKLGTLCGALGVRLS